MINEEIPVGDAFSMAWAQQRAPPSSIAILNRINQSSVSLCTERVLKNLSDDSNESSVFPARRCRPPLAVMRVTFSARAAPQNGTSEFL